MAFSEELVVGYRTIVYNRFISVSVAVGNTVAFSEELVVGYRTIVNNRFISVSVCGR